MDSKNKHCFATIKSYTSVEQSHKLAEILPLESADMFLAMNGILPVMSKYINDGLVTADETAIPCWSLAALLSVIPEPDLVQNSEGTWLVHSWINAYPWSVGGYSNPVDACAAMIEKLHELKML